MRFVLALLMAIAAAEPALSQQSGADRAQQTIFDGTYVAFLRFVNTHWRSEIVPNVMNAHPESDMAIVGSLKAFDPMRPCLVQVQIDRQNHKIPVSKNYYAFTSMYMQPLMLYVSGFKKFRNLQAVVDETIGSMERQTSAFHNECRDGDPKSFFFHIPAYDRDFASPEDFRNFINAASRDPVAVRVAEDMASSGILFVMLHELGHAVLHHSQQGTKEESEADRFASEVFDRSGRSVAYGALGLIVYHGMTDHSARTSLACRLKELLAKGVHPGNLDTTVSDRADRLRAALERHYAKSCGA